MKHACAHLIRPLVAAAVVSFLLLAAPGCGGEASVTVIPNATPTAMPQ